MIYSMPDCEIQVNVGFLIMTLIIMYRHLKKQEKKSKRDTAKYVLCGTDTCS